LGVKTQKHLQDRRKANEDGDKVSLFSKEIVVLKAK
jgi:hypothetical protein